ncbi:hypothetical protein ACVWZK_006751 [Bradyrhizobium sp. GM0.4]
MQAVSIAASAMPTHGNVEGFARGEQAGVAEGGDDRGVDLAMLPGQHLQRNGTADLCLGACRDIGHAAGRGAGDQLGPGRSRALPDIRHQLGDCGAGVRVEQQQLHDCAAVCLA